MGPNGGGGGGCGGRGWNGFIKGQAFLASWRGKERLSGETERHGQRPPDLGLPLEPSPTLGLASTLG